MPAPPPRDRSAPRGEADDRIGPRFGPARLGELTIDADSTFLDPFFYDGTFDADLSVTATLTGQLHS